MGSSKQTAGMKSVAIWLAFAAAMFVGGLCSGIALAQDGAAVVDKRQDHMKAQRKDLLAVRAFIVDKGDLAAAQAGGADLAKRVGEIPGLFPKDTGMAEFPGKSSAKAEIWTEWDKFLAGQKAALSKAEALNTALKGGDKAVIATAFDAMIKGGLFDAGNACGGCHVPFSEKPA
jgi:cytochrome c556